ncbi:MAG: hypothetical protein AAGA18_10405 [Verrucomicrobiota bacterium]
MKFLSHIKFAAPVALLTIGVIFCLLLAASKEKKKNNSGQITEEQSKLTNKESYYNDLSAISVTHGIHDDKKNHVLGKAETSTHARQALQPSATNKGNQRIDNNGFTTMKAEAWSHNAYEFVNHLRQAPDLKLKHDEIMDFLDGISHSGWDENYRNWIGDELMTALRVDTPETAYADLLRILDSDSSSEAMKDYSIQHIAHLINDNIVGAEAVGRLWHELNKGDAATAGTSLMALYRISESQAELVDQNQIINFAMNTLQEGSNDSRLLDSSKGILADHKVTNLLTNNN